MSNYYYSTHGQQHGPFTLEQIREKGLDSATLVWKTTLTEWIPASQMEELQNFITDAPPPLPAQANEKSAIIPKFRYEVDNDQSPNTSLAMWGLLLLTFYIFFYLMYYNKTETESDKSSAFAIYFVISLIIRTIIAIQLSKSAKEDLRNPISWGTVGFLTPIIGLIVYGVLRPMKFVIEFEKNRIDRHLIQKLNEYGAKYYSENKIKEALSISLKTIEISENNVTAHKLAGSCYMTLGSDYMMNYHYNKAKELEEIK